MQHHGSEYYAHSPQPGPGGGVNRSNSIFSSPEWKAQGELIVWDSSRHPYVRPCVRSSTRPHMSEIVIKFHLEHHWGGGLTALGFGLDRIRTHGFHGNR